MLAQEKTKLAYQNQNWHLPKLSRTPASSRKAEPMHLCIAFVLACVVLSCLGGFEAFFASEKPGLFFFGGLLN